jgi:hypothetical protein
VHDTVKKVGKNWGKRQEKGKFLRVQKLAIFTILTSRVDVTGYLEQFHFLNTSEKSRGLDYNPVIAKYKLGFVPKYEDDMDGRGPYLVRPTSLLASAIEGAKYTDDNQITFLRNHPTLVHHNPELLTIWGANIEGRPIESYQQVVRYLLKYMMKNEPISKPFESICKAVVDNAAEDGTLRKTF